MTPKPFCLASHPEQEHEQQKLSHIRFWGPAEPATEIPPGKDSILLLTGRRNSPLLNWVPPCPVLCSVRPSPSCAKPCPPAPRNEPDGSWVWSNAE